MGFTLPRLYPITDTRLSGLSHAEQVSRLIEGGATFVQLRDKSAAPGDFYAQAKAALRVARDHDVTLLINDRVDIAFALKAGGVHLGQTDLPAAAARALLGDAAIIGLSTHNIEQVQLAVREAVNYIAFGPIFQTETKETPDPTTGIQTLEVVRRLVKLPLVAIGGITQANAASVFAAGADAVATISSLMGDPTSIAENFGKMLGVASK